VDMFPDFSIEAMVLKTHSNGARAVPGSQQQRHARRPQSSPCRRSFNFPMREGGSRSGGVKMRSSIQIAFVFCPIAHRLRDLIFSG